MEMHRKMDVNLGRRDAGAGGRSGRVAPGPNQVGVIVEKRRRSTISTSARELLASQGIDLGKVKLGGDSE